MGQLSGYPKALGMSSGVMILLATLPGIPMLPFLALGVGAGYLAWTSEKRSRVKIAEAAQAAAAPDASMAAQTEEPIANALKIDDLKIELGYALLPLVNGPDGTDRLTEQIKALRRSLAIEMGFVMPAVRILDNVQLEANTYVIKIKEVDAGTGRIWPSQYMVMDPAGGQVDVPGIHTTEPTFGLPATWTDAALKEEASLKGYTVVDAATVLSTHLTELLKANMADILSYGEVQKLIKELPKEQGELVKDIVAGADHHFRHPARAATAAGGAHFDPRPVHDPGRHRRCGVLQPQPDVDRGTCPRPAGATVVRPEHLSERLPAAHRALGEMGAGLCRIHHRPGRRPRAGHAAVAAVGVHHLDPPAFRGCRPRRRGPGSVSPRPVFGRSSAPSSSASAPRQAFCRRRRRKIASGCRLARRHLITDRVA